MGQHAQAIDRTLAESQSDLTAQQSLEWIVRFLVVVRYLFVIAGLAFLAWELSEHLSEGNNLGLAIVFEIAVTSVIGPARSEPDSTT